MLMNQSNANHAAAKTQTAYFPLSSPHPCQKHLTAAGQDARDARAEIALHAIEEKKWEK